MSSGVPQGLVLEPLLFILYINKLPELLKSGVRLFADDSLMFNIRANKTVLQKDLEILEDFAKKGQLDFNVNKCAVLSVGEKGFAFEYF